MRRGGAPPLRSAEHPLAEPRRVLAAMQERLQYARQLRDGIQQFEVDRQADHRRHQAFDASMPVRRSVRALQAEVDAASERTAEESVTLHRMQRRLHSEADAVAQLQTEVDSFRQRLRQQRRSLADEHADVEGRAARLREAMAECVVALLPCRPSRPAPCDLEIG